MERAQVTMVERYGKASDFHGERPWGSFKVWYEGAYMHGLELTVDDGIHFFEYTPAEIALDEKLGRRMIYDVIRFELERLNIEIDS